jgi:hypothetical protein
MTEEIENIKTDNQVKSKKRVTDHGEVFTSEREVNAMLDLVKQETERIAPLAPNNQVVQVALFQLVAQLQNLEDLAKQK